MAFHCHDPFFFHLFSFWPFKNAVLFPLPLLFLLCCCWGMVPPPKSVGRLLNGPSHKSTTNSWSDNSAGLGLLDERGCAAIVIWMQKRDQFQSEGGERRENSMIWMIWLDWQMSVCVGVDQNRWTKICCCCCCCCGSIWWNRGAFPFNLLIKISTYLSHHLLVCSLFHAANFYW